jgi:hypothetical protein
MSEQLAIYLWSISTNISCGLGGIGIAIIIFGFVLFPAIEMMEDGDFPTVKVISSAIVGVIMFALSGLVPSKQDLALIFAYPYLKSGAEQAIQSETMKKITTISSKYLDKVIVDLEERLEQNNDR